MSYAQPGGKRQKVREGRAGDGADYFQGIEPVEFKSGAGAAESGVYRHYGAERLLARTHEDWLKCSLSLTDFRAHAGYGLDSQGRPIPTRPWDDGTNSLESHKRCLKALLELCVKLGVKYWTAFDSDLVPLGPVGPPDEECRAQWEDMTEYIQELCQRMHVKLLWIAPDLHSHPRYMSGALTSSEASVFAAAAAQIKRCLETSQRLGAECFMLWPYREGYDAIFQTDVAREIKLFSKLLKITAEYKDRLNYRCQLLIMPYYNTQQGPPWPSGYMGGPYQDAERVHSYMWDVTSCLYFLKHYNLDRYYKVCTPPGHHMYMANVYNMLGGVAITDQFDCSDCRTVTLMMKCIIDQGSPPAGGINLKLCYRGATAIAATGGTSANDLRELVCVYVRRLDALARGLRAAAALAADHNLTKYVQQRYSSYFSGFGSRLATADVTMDECDEYHKKNPPHEPGASKTEHYNIVFQRYLDTCDHV